ncbi:dihydropyrimidinase [Anaerococcus sp. AGMB00486]|uniref:Dihydropyrimidinase n=1 Tax=Anaerococcus faecalis TaxID=2742993 RepID=A0ABX2NCE3_9FIRM|nr:dihydropyrimidinase [Anaerococcus faecalis]NVF12313.1 dihydropyrimidinase [Anaerococcus faecalis]
MKTLIKNGKVVLKDKVDFLDILLEGRKISKIGKNIEEKVDKIIDAKDKLVIPGGVDVHTHMSLDLGKFIACDDFASGTYAASFGATTTICDHIGDLGKGASLHSLIDHYHDIADGKAYIDYSFHGAMYEENESLLSEIEDLKNEGIPSIKIYTTYGGKLNDDQILRVLKTAKKTGSIVCVHCENDGLIYELRNEAIRDNKLSPKYHALTRPNQSEAEAINRLIYLSETAGYPKLYIVHTSTKEGLDEIKRARERGAKNLYCETCTQYLTYDESKYMDNPSDEAVKYICAPPLRKKDDIEALWDGIRNGDVDVVATDHCPFIYESEKKPYADNFIKAPGGIPGVEERIEVVLTLGLQRKISLVRLMEVLSLNPSKIFGFYPNKGSIEEGTDADLAILTMNGYTIKQENRHSRCDYTSYEGFDTDFKVDTVISKGKIILDEKGYYAKAGMGEFIKRILSKE